MNAKSITILLVEDNTGDARLIHEILSEAGEDSPGSPEFDLVHADRLSTGLAYLEECDIDVILLDLSLPDSQGLDTFNEVYAQAPEMPIVVLTGLDDETLAITAVREGAQDYLVKGQVDNDLLICALRYAIERKRAEEALRKAYNDLKVQTRELHVDLICANKQLQRGIAGRREAEEALRRQAHLVQQIMDTVPEGVLLLDADRHITLANPAAREYLTVLADAEVGTELVALGEYAVEDLLKPPSEGPHCVAATDASSGRVFEVEARPMEAESGRGEWVLVLHDVTQEQEMQERVRNQERLAAVGQLAAGIAHDFNNLLTGIIGYAQLLTMRADVSELAKKDLQRIEEQGQQAAHLIRQILDFSRKSIIQRQPLNLNTFIKEAIRFLDRTIPENVRISFDAEPDTYTIHADPAQIQDMLTNLSVNAKDAMQGGGTLNALQPHAWKASWLGDLSGNGVPW